MGQLKDTLAINHPVKNEMLLQGYTFVGARNFVFKGRLRTAYRALQKSYHDMPADRHLNRGEGERFRRYDSFLIDPRTG